MTDPRWSPQGAAGDPWGVGVGAWGGPTPPDIAVTTGGRELWLRRFTPGAAGAPGTWRWETRGTVPLASRLAVLEAAPVPDPMVAVCAYETDVAVSYRRGGTAVLDTIAGPVNNGDVIVGLCRPGDDRMFLIDSNMWPYLGEITGFSTLTGRVSTALAQVPGLVTEPSTPHVTMLAASPAPGAAPVVHVVTNTFDDTDQTTHVHIGFFDGTGWTWVDPGQPPEGQVYDVADAVGVPVAGGGLEGWIVSPVSSSTTFHVLHGGGRVWSWTDLGRPAGEAALGVRAVSWTVDATGQGRPRVLVSDQAFDGDVPYLSTGTGAWERFPTLPAGGFVEPGWLVPAGPDQRPWAVGLGADGLWSLAPDAAAAEVHPAPVRVREVAGHVLADSPGDPDRGVVVDGSGRLWFQDGGAIWTLHGTPAPGVTLRRAAGTAEVQDPDGAVVHSVFLVGDDEHVWERTDAGGTWRWVDRETPTPGRRLRSVAPPVVRQDLVPTSTDIAVVPDDGHLWVLTSTLTTGTWTDRKSPAGRQVATVVGAQVARDETVAVVVTSDSHLWGHSPGTDWTDMGVPEPEAENGVANGLGVSLAPMSRRYLRVAVTDRLGGKVWTVGWPDPPDWTTLGTPPAVAIGGAVGVFSPIPENELHIVVLGRDGNLWANPGTDPSDWVSWGRPDPARVTSAVARPSYGASSGMYVGAVGDDGKLHTVDPTVPPSP